MPAKLTQEEFVSKSIKIHSNKYSYKFAKYTNNRTKVKIICPTHGIFFQKPNGHLLGWGCLKCAVQKRSKLRTKTASDFLKKSKIIHKDKYSYSLSSYKCRKTKIKITCLKCGNTFLQSPHNHLKGQGCPLCSGNITKSSKTFTRESNIVHKNKYSYKLASYKNSHSKLKILCPIHGIFKQTPANHLNGHGCPKCKAVNTGNIKRKSKLQFIKEAKRVHDGKYNYNLICYTNGHYDKIKISCPIHGIFKQTPHHHLNGRGCPKCHHNISKPEKIWLDEIRVPDRTSNRHVTLKINSKKYFLDGFIKKSKTVYEFYGDYWHGNPKIYKANERNRLNKKTFGELYRLTMQRERELKKAGYNLVTIWESDFKKQLKNI